VQAIVDAQPAGTTFRLGAGIYLNQDITPKGGDVFLGGARAAIFDGTNTTVFAFEGTATNVTVNGLVIQNYTAGAYPQGQLGAIDNQHTGSSNPAWVISNNEFRYNAAYGVRAGSDDQLLGNFAHHNGEAGLGGVGTNILVQDNEIAFNNPNAAFDQYWEAGGTKFTSTTNLILRHNYVHDNRGPGLWTDSDNLNVLIENNTTTNNEGPGIMHEISYSATIRHNTVSGNGAVENLCCWLWGSQIEISTSQNVQIYGNTVTAPSSANGIGVVQQNRGGTYVGSPVNVHNNDITMQTDGSGHHGMSGAAKDYDPSNAFFAGQTWDYNTYHVANPANSYWEWRGHQSWAGLQAAGQEAHGTVQ
jgi:parallel beta-helix repeat protein